MLIPFIKRLLLLTALGLPAVADTTPAPPATPPPAATVSLDTWNAALPFSFIYGENLRRSSSLRGSGARK